MRITITFKISVSALPIIGPTGYENVFSENFDSNITDLDTQTCGIISFTGKNVYIENVAQ